MISWRAQRILLRRNTIRMWEKGYSVPFNSIHRSFNYRHGLYIPFRAFDKFYKRPRTSHKLYWKFHPEGIQ